MIAHLISVYHFSYEYCLDLQFDNFFDFYLTSFSLPYIPDKSKKENYLKDIDYDAPVTITETKRIIK